MTDTWTPLTANHQELDQITSDEYNEFISNLNFLRAPPDNLYNPAISDPNITTSSSTLVDLTGFSVSITVQGNPGLVEIIFSARTNGNTRFDIVIDNLSITGDSDELGNGGTTNATTIVRYVSLATGLHTIKIQWRTTSGAVTLYPASLPQLYVREIKG